jgi:hypothetical protein
MSIFFLALTNADSQSQEQASGARLPWAGQRGAREASMTEAEWLACADPEEMLPLLREAGERELRLLTCACLRRLWPLLPEGPCRQAVEVGEAWADGLAGRADLDAAFDAAVDFDVSLPDDPSLRQAAAEAVQGAAAVFPHYGEALYAAAGLADLQGRGAEERAALAGLVRCVFGPRPFRGVPRDPAWLTADVLTLARAAYDNRILPSGHLDPDRLLVLADAVEEAGCTEAAVLDHLRSPGPHVRGCWALDLVLRRE